MRWTPALVPLILLIATARADDPPAPTTPADDETAVRELEKGDTVMLLVPEELKERGRKRGIRSFFVIASATMETYKELDAFIGPRGQLVDDATTFVLPSGRLATPIPDRTLAVVLELKPADGVVNDTMAVRVRLLESKWKGKEFWVRRSRMVLRSRAHGPKVQPETLLRQARALESLGRADQARAFYARVAREFPDTPEAREASSHLLESDGRRPPRP